MKNGYIYRLVAFIAIALIGGIITRPARAMGGLSIFESVNIQDQIPKLEEGIESFIKDKKLTLPALISFIEDQSGALEKLILENKGAIKEFAQGLGLDATATANLNRGLDWISTHTKEIGAKAKPYLEKLKTEYGDNPSALLNAIAQKAETVFKTGIFKEEERKLVAILGDQLPVVVFAALLAYNSNPSSTPASVKAIIQPILGAIGSGSTGQIAESFNIFSNNEFLNQLSNNLQQKNFNAIASQFDGYKTFVNDNPSLQEALTELAGPGLQIIKDVITKWHANNAQLQSIIGY